MLQKRVLSYLEENRGNIITGGQIARQLGVSRTAVWKAVHALQDKGHEIETMANSGYRLENVSDGLSESNIAALLTTRNFGRQLELHQSIDSTNTYLKELDTFALPEGYTVIADQQIAGRGRLGRVFYSPSRQGVYLSILLKPDIAIHEVPMLTICAAVAVCRAIDMVCGVSTNIKWVNDIFLDGKKLCGILSEALVSAELREVESVVVGIGVNTGTIDPAVADIATSIYEVKGIRGIRNQLIAEILNQFEAVYDDFVSITGRQAVIDAYTARLFIIGKLVKVVQRDVSFSARVLGIDHSGSLLVEDEEGSKITVCSGEIKLF